MMPKDKGLAGSLRRLEAAVDTIDLVSACQKRDRVGLGTGSATGRRAAKAAAHDTWWSMAIFRLQQNRFGNAVFDVRVFPHSSSTAFYSFFACLSTIFHSFDPSHSCLPLQTTVVGRARTSISQALTIPSLMLPRLQCQ